MNDKPRSPKSPVENADYFSFASRVMASALKRAARAENVETDLAGLIALREQLDAGIAEAVIAMRDADPEQASWSKIGRACGTSRQAAQQRFGRKTVA
jgi:hypothetical protein